MCHLSPLHVRTVVTPSHRSTLSTPTLILLRQVRLHGVDHQRLLDVPSKQSRACRELRVRRHSSRRERVRVLGHKRPELQHLRGDHLRHTSCRDVLDHVSWEAAAEVAHPDDPPTPNSQGRGNREQRGPVQIQIHLRRRAQSSANTLAHFRADGPPFAAADRAADVAPHTSTLAAPHRRAHAPTNPVALNGSDASTKPRSDASAKSGAHTAADRGADAAAHASAHAAAEPCANAAAESCSNAPANDCANAPAHGGANASAEPCADSTT